MIAKETLFLTADRENVVKEGDAKAQFLLVRAGHELPDALAEKYGVKGDKAAPATSPDAAGAAEAAAVPPTPSPASQAKDERPVKTATSTSAKKSPARKSAKK